jgi:hypothetical protein
MPNMEVFLVSLLPGFCVSPGSLPLFRTQTLEEPNQLNGSSAFIHLLLKHVSSLGGMNTNALPQYTTPKELAEVPLPILRIAMSHGHLHLCLQ